MISFYVKYYLKQTFHVRQAGISGKIIFFFLLTHIFIFLHVCVCTVCVSADSHCGASYLSEQQPRQGVQVSHVRVVAEDAVDPLLLVREYVVQLPFQL